jgi:hypothetical protein
LTHPFSVSGGVDVFGRLTPALRAALGRVRPVRALAACAVAIVFALLAMGQMNELQRGMHVQGDPARITADLDHVFNLGPDGEQAEGVIRVWRNYEDATREFGGGRETATPFEVAYWFVGIDSLLLVPLYTGGLILLLALAYSRIGRWQSPKHPDPQYLPEQARQMGTTAKDVLPLHRRAALTAIVAIVLTGLADLAENLGYLLLVRFGSGPQPSDFASAAFDRRVEFLWWAAVFKWLFAAVAVAYALVVLWLFVVEWSLLRSRTFWGRLRPVFRLAGAHVALVVAFAAMLGHEQIADLVRRWTLWQLLVSTIFTGCFSLLTWLVVRRLLVHGQWVPTWLWPEERRVLWRRVLFWGLVGLAAAQLVLHLLGAGSERRSGWGLVIPASVLILLAVLGLFVRKVEPPAPPVSALAVSDPMLPRLLAASVLVLFALGVFHAGFGYLVFTRAWTVYALLPAVGALIGVGVWFFAGRRLSPLAWATAGALLPTLALATGDSQPSDVAVTVAGAVLLPVFAWRLYDELARRPFPSQTVSWTAVGAIALIVGLVAIAMLARPIAVGQTIGVVGVIALFMFALAGLIGLAIWAVPILPVPRALVALGVRRFPLLVLIVFWFVVAGVFDRGGYHDIRIDRADTAAIAPNLAQAFDCWLGKNGLGGDRCAVVQPGTTPPRAVPLFLVATTGGGIRAAFWTSLVLDCAFEVDAGFVRSSTPCQGSRPASFERSNRLFALSGISGGSVGLAAYAAHLVEKRSTTAEQGRTGAQPWLERRLSVDGLSPTGLWWLFVELPRQFLQFRLERDRSQLLEESWEREWPERELSTGLFELWRDEPQVPLLLLNGTSVEDGCRFNVSVLNANVEGTANSRPTCRSMSPFDEAPTPKRRERLGAHQRVNPTSTLTATRDLADSVCGNHDVPLASAAFLSGRFPFVNPSGRVESVCPEKSRNSVAYVVDGGYLDTSGASPLVELSGELLPLIEGWNRRREGAQCVVPFLIQIDNGFEDSGSERNASRPKELTLPLGTVFAARIARAAQARAGAALLFNKPFAGARIRRKQLSDRYAHFVNQAHPGPRAPLGWAQSRASEDELRSQLRQAKNLDALRELRGWIAASRSSNLACTGR